jgi:hypothetical protein
VCLTPLTFDIILVLNNPQRGIATPSCSTATKSNPSGQSDSTPPFALLRMLRVLRLAKLVRLMRASRLYKRWVKRVTLSTGTQTFLQCVFAGAHRHLPAACKHTTPLNRTAAHTTPLYRAAAAHTTPLYRTAANHASPRPPANHATPRPPAHHATPWPPAHGLSAMASGAASRGLVMAVFLAAHWYACLLGLQTMLHNDVSCQGLEPNAFPMLC